MLIAMVEELLHSMLRKLFDCVTRSIAVHSAWRNINAEFSAYCSILFYCSVVRTGALFLAKK
jgi:hypothetical protein